MRLGKKPPQADEQAYIEVQGHVPVVKVENGLFKVLHPDGENGTMVVTSHIPPSGYGEVELLTSKGPFTFVTGLLRQFHGDPCERNSIRKGGKGYERE